MFNNIKEAREAMAAMEPHFKVGFSGKEREIIDYLHRLFFGAPVKKTACQSCYRDAYVLVSCRLKKENELPKRSNYELKKGIVYAPKAGVGFYAGENIPDEVAEKWLAEFPHAIRKFARFPEDWEKRAASLNDKGKEKKRKSKKEPKPTESAAPVEGEANENTTIDPDGQAPEAPVEE
jgi:hypothetical protein